MTNVYLATQPEVAWPGRSNETATLLAVVKHYDQRFGLNLSAQQKADLVEFLKSL
jgi:hypothetical protein